MSNSKFELRTDGEEFKEVICSNDLSFNTHEPEQHKRNKGVELALEKMPNAKFIWVHPDDISFTYGFPITVKTSPMIERGQFVLTEADIESEIKP